jgi:hypothetical protein
MWNVPLVESTGESIALVMTLDEAFEVIFFIALESIIAQYMKSRSLQKGHDCKVNSNI